MLSKCTLTNVDIVKAPFYRPVIPGSFQVHILS